MREWRKKSIFAALTLGAASLLFLVMQGKRQHFEFENLTPMPGRIPVSIVQEMSEFRGEWSGDHQLFLQQGLPESGVTFRFESEFKGNARLEIGYTRAPDYGNYLLRFDGSPLGEIAGFSGEVQARTFVSPLLKLYGQEHVLDLMPAGKEEASTGIRIGLDTLAIHVDPLFSDFSDWLATAVLVASLIFLVHPLIRRLRYRPTCQTAPVGPKDDSGESESPDPSVTDSAPAVSAAEQGRSFRFDSGRNLMLLGGFAASFVLACFGTLNLTDSNPWTAAGWIPVLAGILFLVAAWRWGWRKLDPGWDEESSAEENLCFLWPERFQYLLLATGLGASLLSWGAYLASDSGMADRFWILSIGLTSISVLAWPLPKARPNAVLRTAAVLVTIASLALVLRHMDLVSLPWFVHGDEGEHARSAWALSQGRAPVLGLGWFGFPNLGFYLQSLGIDSNGLSVYGMRISSVVIGALTVLLIYGLAHVSFGVRTAVPATLIAAWFHVHLYFSRVGLTNVQAPFFATLAALSFLLALRYRSRRMALLTGIVLGVGYQSYPAVQALLVGFAALLVLFFLIRRREFRQVRSMILVFPLGILIGLGPFLHFAYAHSDRLYARVHVISVFTPEQMETHKQRLEVDSAAGVLALQFAYDLLAPVCKSSTLWYGNGKRMFSTGIRALYVLGFPLFLFLGLIHARRGERPYWEMCRFLIPIFIILIVSATAAMTYSAPAWQRLVPMLPFVLLVPAFLVDRCTRPLLQLPFGRYLAWVPLILLLGLSWQYNRQSFFEDPSLRQAGESRLQTFLVHHIAKVPAEAKVYLFSALPHHYGAYYNFGSIWLERPFSVGCDIRQTGEELPAALLPELDPERNAAFVYFGSDEDRILPVLSSLFAVGSRREERVDRFSESIISYHVEKQFVREYLEGQPQPQ